MKLVRGLSFGAIVLALTFQPAITGAEASSTTKYGAPEWFPLRHSLNGGKILVGCTYLSYGGQYGYDCNGYHPWWALDLGAEIGTPVYAAGAGFATIHSHGSTCGSSGYGNSVVVDHGSYGKTIYAHLSRIDVPSNGEWVDQNTQIGLVGNTGDADCSFPHLHFEHFVKTPGPGGDAMNPGELKACHGKTLLTYPASFAESTWQGIPWGKYHAYGDGTACAAPPPSVQVKVSGMFTRYLQPSPFDHWVTDAAVPGSYQFEQNLGLLLLTEQAGTVALYQCLSKPDHFISHDPNCEGKKVVRLEGYAYTSDPGVPAIQIYRCYNSGNHDHFVTQDPNCEGHGKNEGSLGWTLAVASFTRYLQPSPFDHWVTDAAVPGSYQFEQNLGLLLLTEQAGTVALYQCLSKPDHFISHDPNCEGKKVVRLEGYAYTSDPGVPAIQIYRCYNSGNHDHFVTQDPNCEGHGKNEGSLGWTLAVASFTRYLQPSPFDHWVTDAAVPGSYQFEQNLGLLLLTEQAGTVALYQCLSKPDHFISHDPNCEGKKVVRLEGYAYTSDPGVPAIQIYRCYNSGNHDHFVTQDPNCEGHGKNEGSLGWTLEGAF